MEEARENVALNGWQIISIEEFNSPATSNTMRGMQADAGTFLIKIKSVGEGSVAPDGEVNVNTGEKLILKLMPAPCEKVGSVIYDGNEITPNGDEATLEKIESNGNVVVVFEKNGSQCESNGIFSADLKEVGAVYFELGKFQKQLSEKEKSIIENADPEKHYVIIGHTDDVKVIPNVEYADNFQLSLKRAEFIKKFLIDKDVPEDNLKIVGLGPAFPAAKNKKEGQPLNRRAILYERTRK